MPMAVTKIRAAAVGAIKVPQIERVLKNSERQLFSLEAAISPKS